MSVSTPKSFTVEYPGISNELRTPCGVSEAYDPANGIQNHPQLVQFTGLWDTGAMRTCISKRLVERLNLKPIGMANMGHANGTSEVPTHMVNIGLPNNVGFHSLVVLECDLGGADVLIGMDIISKGDFAVTNTGGKTLFSFRIPSTQKIDFLSIDAHTPVVTEKKPHRNDPCPCGSGKKYKNCCGK